ncbi:helix-loop-helix DNA-binding domain-containing transcription factor [Phycomyces blakesleeanus]|uniref:Helix-loop-helix DNA-binding domain-containing transcription factor n=2 Tax=Phycomyces blakesleeanus TaxID=4837 RepID=A0A163EP88_PHYB8|nr:helix-loop-helix DNA-binding domain-containing transcription factor [Phycomyces blakesleeanus NRRL 1555(-)]OAD80580.1 helix-loop-helix DNA-binding domain-containing transcription factor [Phycomyces blakesleeanus NRRL 1555(-)]|eukprot:XP_018298620.1 helix-loop-helix DNA-binding domain-containing transcription factor [Phycomyces blakesleeanus NRRL 1555(-)]
MPPNKTMIDSWDNVPLYYPHQQATITQQKETTQNVWPNCEIDKTLQDRPFVAYLDQFSLPSFEPLSMRETRVTSISSLRHGLCRTPSPQTTRSHDLNPTNTTNMNSPNTIPDHNDITIPVYLYKSNSIVVPHQISTNAVRKSSLFMPQLSSTLTNTTHTTNPPLSVPIPNSPVSSVSSQSSQSSLSSNQTSKNHTLARSKRDNHILSEQRRRNMIRTGFKEMTDLIPTLKNISQSKSIILFKAADYMKDLERRNKHLRDKLSALQWRAKLKAGQIKHHPVKSSPLVPLPHRDHLKQVRILEDQIRQQQRLLTQHNLPTPTPTPTIMQSNHDHNLVNTFSSTATHSQQQQQQQPSSHVHTTAHNTQAILVPMSKEDNSFIQWHSSSSASSSASSLAVPSLSIPADEDFGLESAQRDRWLSCGKMNQFQ